MLAYDGNTLFYFGSWDFIYAEYVMDAGRHHRSIVWQVTCTRNLWEKYLF